MTTRVEPKRDSSAIAAALLTVLATTPAAAQEDGVFIDRGRLDAAPVTPPRVIPAPSAPATPQAQAPAEIVTLQSVTLVGETDAAVLDVIDRRAASLRGKPITRPLLEELLGLINTYYQRQGYALFRAVAPPQRFDGGRVEIVVMRGYVSEIVVDGVSGRDKRNIEAYAGPLLKQKPLTRAALERAVLLISDMPGLTVTSRFEQAQTDPNAVRLRMTARKKRLELGAGADNQGATLLGRTQFETSATVNGALRAGDRAQISYFFPEQFDRFQFFAANYGAPIGVDGWRLQGSASWLRTNPGAIGLSGHAQTYGVQASYPIIRATARSLFASAALDALHSDNAYLGQTLTSERTRVLRGALAYSGNAAKHVTGLAATLSIGIDGLGAQAPAYLGGAGFTKLNLRASRDTALAANTRFSLRAAAQLGDKALPTSERMQFGGSALGRGFPAGFASSTRGMSATAEATQRIALGRAPMDKAHLETFAFIDAARLASDGVFLTRDRSLSSAGLGVGLNVMKNFSLRVQYAAPIESPAGARASRMSFTVASRS